jgi:hypothetical protein
MSASASGGSPGAVNWLSFQRAAGHRPKRKSTRAASAAACVPTWAPVEAAVAEKVSGTQRGLRGGVLRLLIDRVGIAGTHQRLALNTMMFQLYGASGAIFRKNLMDQHTIILGLFSGAGGRFSATARPPPPPLRSGVLAKARSSLV